MAEDLRNPLADLDGLFEDRSVVVDSLGIELELFFIGAGLQHMQSGESQTDDGVFAGHKGWRALPGLTKVSAWVSEDALENSDGPLLLRVNKTSGTGMAERIAGCSRVMVI